MKMREIDLRIYILGENARSDDLELIEINMPADYGTIDLGGARDAAQP